MLVKTLLIALVSFIGFLECGVGNSMIQRPIVMGPLVGLVLGDVNAGVAAAGPAHASPSRDTPAPPARPQPPFLEILYGQCIL